jgi:hypothetical protein
MQESPAPSQEHENTGFKTSGSPDRLGLSRALLACGAPEG